VPENFHSYCLNFEFELPMEQTTFLLLTIGIYTVPGKRVILMKGETSSHSLVVYEKSCLPDQVASGQNGQKSATIINKYGNQKEGKK
jgi:hypothetical protein